MGAYITQYSKHVAFCSQKLNDTHLKYTVGHKELHSNIIVSKEFCAMLLDAKLQFTATTSTSSQTAPCLIVSFTGSTMLKSTILRFTLFLAETMSLLTHFPSSPMKRKFLPSNTLFPYEWTLLMILFL